MATKISGVVAEFPAVKILFKVVPISAVQQMLQAEDRVQEYGRVAVMNAKGRDISKANVFSRIIA
jgi:hypothetical protein